MLKLRSPLLPGGPAPFVWAAALAGTALVAGVALRLIAPGEVQPIRSRNSDPSQPKPARQEVPQTTFDHLGVVYSREVVDVVASVDCIVQALPKSIGEHVRRGEVLAVLDSPGLRKDLVEARSSAVIARADARAAEIDVNLAAEALKRLERMDDLVSPVEVRTQRAQLEQQTARAKKARAVAEAASARREYYEHLNLAQVVIAKRDSSPSLYYVKVGASVRAGERLMRTIDVSERHVRFAVSPEEAAGFEVGTSLHGYAVSAPWSFKGHVEALAPEVDGPSGMVFVEARLDPDADVHVLPGLPVRVRRARTEQASGLQQAAPGQASESRSVRR